MLDQNPPPIDPVSSVFGEYVKQISTQSALLAGFAFTGLTVVSYDPATPQSLTTAFGTCASVSIALELLAVFISATLSCVARVIPIRSRFALEIWATWLAYFGGLLAFLAALVRLAWIKIRPAALPITGIAVAAAIGMAVIIYRFQNKAAMR